MALPQVLETTEKTQIYEGTAADILSVLQTNAFAGQRLRLIVEPEEDLSENMPDPPFTVRDEAHLKELLEAGISSLKHPVTDETWEYIRQEVHKRYAARRQSAQP